MKEFNVGDFVYYCFDNNGVIQLGFSTIEERFDLTFDVNPPVPTKYTLSNIVGRFIAVENLFESLQEASTYAESFINSFGEISKDCKIFVNEYRSYIGN